MKAAKLMIGLFVFMLFLVPLASAFDLPPWVTLTSDVDTTTTTITLTAVAGDLHDNAGMAWIKLYEDGNEIGHKDCDSATVCSFIKPIVKTAPGGTFTYRAEAYDMGGHSVFSEEDEVVVRFEGVDEENPEYSNIRATPSSPAEYGQDMEFNVTWTDNSLLINKVTIEHDFFGSVLSTDVLTHNGDEYSYTLNSITHGIDIGTYQWRMIAEDKADQGANTNATPWQGYEIIRADVDVNWTITPAETVDYGNQTNVSCVVADSANTETQLTLYRDGTEVSNPDVNTLLPGTYEYTCSGAQTPHYESVSDIKTLTVNKLASSVNLSLDGADADLVNVERLSQVIDIDGDRLSGDGIIILSIDNTDVANSTSHVDFGKAFNTTGTHNITLTHPATANYAASSDANTVAVVDTTAPDSVTGLTKLSATYTSIEIGWTNPVNDDYDGAIIYVESDDDPNSTMIFTNEDLESTNITGLQPGTQYNITIHTSDTYGNVNTTDVTLITSTVADTGMPQWSIRGIEMVEDLDYDDQTFGDDITSETQLFGFVVDDWFDEDYFFQHDEGNFNLSESDSIIIGTPCDNNVTAQLLGNPSDCSNVFDNNTGIIKIVESNGKTQVLVTGNTVYDLFLAGRALRDYKEHNLSGKEVKVTGTVNFDWNEWENFSVDISSVETSADTGDDNDLSNYPNFLITNYTIDAFFVFDGDDDYVLWPMIEILQGMQYLVDDLLEVKPMVKWSDNIAIDSVWFEHDFSGTMQNETALFNASEGIYYIDIEALPAGGYEWRSFANDTSGNTVSTYWHDYDIEKVSAFIEVRFDGMHVSEDRYEGPSTTIIEGESIEVFAEIYDGDTDYFEIYQDSIRIFAGDDDEFDEDVTFNTPGESVLTFVYNETQNYTERIQNYTIEVIPIVRNVTLDRSPDTYIVPVDTNADFDVTVWNRGNVQDNYTLSIADNGGMSYTFINSTTTENLYPNAGQIIRVNAANNVTGNFNVTVQAVSNTDSSVNATITLEVKVVDYSEVINSTIDSTYYASGNYSVIEIPQLLAATVVDSTVVDNLSSIETSSVYRSTIDNSQITSNSQINDSQVTNSILSNCIVLNSTLEDIIASDCYIENSYADPSNLTGSVITGDSTIIDSNVTYSNVTDSAIAGSNVDHSTVDNSTIEASDVDDSTIIDSYLNDGSVVSNSNITNSGTADSTITNSEVTDSGIGDNSNVSDSTITNSSIIDSIVEENSVIINSTVDGSNVTNSTIIDSDVPEGNDIDDAWIENGVIVNGTVNGQDYTGNSTNLTDAVNYAPEVASYSIAPTTITVGGTVNFNVDVTDANIGGVLNDSIVSYEWDFGDGANSTDANTTHAYNSVGTFYVSFRAQDKFGASAWMGPITITVNAEESQQPSSSGSRRRSSDPRIIFLDMARGSFTTLELNQGDMIEFMFEGEQHRITVSDVTFDHVDLIVRSNPVLITLMKYETKHINLDGDMLNDISIRLDDIIGNDAVKLTLGLKEIPSYEPIIISEPLVDDNQTIDTGDADEGDADEGDADDNQTIDTGEADDNQTAEPQDEELSIWQKFVKWLKGLFGIGDETEEDEADEDEADEDEADEDEADEDEADEESGEDDESSTKLWVGILFVFIILALGLSIYFVVRKKVIEKRIENYLM